MRCQRAEFKGGEVLHKTLLIVDDSHFMRLLIKKVLKDEAIHIFEATNGKQAMELYQKHRPDLVTLDITMPGESGLDLLVQLRAYDAQAKVIMCSSMIYKENVQEALEKGAIGFLVKPFRDDLFLQAIQNHI